MMLIEWKKRRGVNAKSGVRILFAALVTVLVFAACTQASPIVGEIIQFGEYEWIVLDVLDDKALILTKDIIERHVYNDEQANVTWETCDLREYLNGLFLQIFKKEEQEQIIETKVSNPDNLWYGTNGGNDTNDRVFLLSIEEVDKYFGDSGDYLNKRRKDKLPDGNWGLVDDGYNLSNENDSDRIAKHEDAISFWWLRSPGNDVNCAATICNEGYVYVYGHFVFYSDGGVRPALWLKLQ
ncbi:MAG: DUF6273 domain-containing protein [Synergistaceae bacterium]|nr:DUF6273 domain-containing protein [Synergistaceae bacterium]